MSDVANKWGELVAERGFAQIPNYLLFLNQFRTEEERFSPIELLVLVQLAGGWWRATDKPFPGIATLAARCGASERQIQRAVSQLEKLGLIKRIKRRARGFIASNAYDLTPLAAYLGEVAKAFPNAFPRRTFVKPAKAEASGDGAPVPTAFRVKPKPKPKSTETPPEIS
jgi:DNA-binding transcriptional MocR family regulator